jgi:HEAT repeat protein
MYRATNPILITSVALTLLGCSQLAFAQRAAVAGQGEVPQAAPGVQASTSPQEPIEALIRKLSYRDPEVRQKAAEALGDMDAKAASAVKPLLKHLKDSDPGVRFFAARALGHIGREPKLCVPALLKAMDDRDRDVYMQATISLTAFPEYARRIVPRLIAGFRSNDKGRRYYCMITFGDYGKQAQAAIPLMIKATTDTVLETRLRAVVTLGQIGVYNREVESALLGCLKSEDQMVVDVAAAALGRIGIASPAVLQGLAKTFERPNDTSGAQAAISFALLLHKDGDHKLPRSLAERSWLHRQIDAAEANIRQHMGLFGDARTITEPALKQLEQAKKDLDAPEAGA